MKPGGERERFSMLTWQNMSNFDGCEASALCHAPTSITKHNRTLCSTTTASTTLFNPSKHLKPTDCVRGRCVLRERSESLQYRRIPVNDAWREAVRSECKWVRVSYSRLRWPERALSMGALSPFRGEAGENWSNKRWEYWCCYGTTPQTVGKAFTHAQ